MFKTDWNANDYLNFEDLNRIEELTEDLYDYIVDNIDPNLPIPQYTFADEEKEIIGREGFKTDRDKNWIDSYRDFFAIENNITYLYERIKELYPELEISWITPRMGGQPYSLTPRDVVQIDKDLTNSFLELSFPDDLWEEFDSSPLDEQEKIIRTFSQPIEDDSYLTEDPLYFSFPDDLVIPHETGVPYIQFPDVGPEPNDYYIDFGLNFGPAIDSYYEIKIQTPSTMDSNYSLISMDNDAMLEAGGIFSIGITSSNELSVFLGNNTTETYAALTTVNTLSPNTEYIIRLDLSTNPAILYVNGTNWGTINRITFIPQSLSSRPNFIIGNGFLGTQPAFTGKIYYLKAKGYNATGDIVVGDYSLYGDVGSATVTDKCRYRRIDDDGIVWQDEGYQNGTIMGGTVVSGPLYSLNPIVASSNVEPPNRIYTVNEDVTSGIKTTVYVGDTIVYRNNPDNPSEFINLSELPEDSINTRDLQVNELNPASSHIWQINNDIYSVKTSDSFKIILENTINKNEITLYEYDYNNSEVITNLKYIYTTMGIVKNIYEEHPAYEYIKALPNDYVINAVDFQGAYYPNSPISYVDLNRIETNLKNLTEAVHSIEEE